MSEAKITFFGGVGSVTGANFLLEIHNNRILVDCGLIQGEREAVMENSKDFGYEPSSIDMLFITHAHLDHVGRIPKLVKEGFSGFIYSTRETMALAHLILEDALSLMDKFSREEGILPLYSSQDVKNTFSLWKTIPYHTETTFGDFSLNGFSVLLKDAGHILGSTMFQFSYSDIKGKVKKVIFTGDLGNSPTPLLKDTESIEDADYVVMESVYGDRVHEPKNERREKLKEIILGIIERRGTLVIPAFSLERTQVLIYELNKLVESKAIPPIPVYVDSPLAIKVTEVYKESVDLFNDKAKEEILKGDDLFNFPYISYTKSNEQSVEIDHSKNPKIIIAGSGMSIGGRVRHHEEIYLPDAKNTILLVGYQTVGSVGRYLSEGAKKVKINGEEVSVRAKVESIMGYSSHKDSDNLLEFVGTAQGSLKKAFVVMGELRASTFLAQRINNELGIKAVCPEAGVGYELE